MAVVTLSSSSTLFAATSEPTYAAAREGTGTNLYASELGWIGQYFGGNYDVNQVFASFDLSSIPAGATISAAKLILTVPESYGSFTVEARASAFTPGNAASFVPGSGLAAKTLLGSGAMTAGFDVTREIVVTGATRANLASIVLHGSGQRTNTAPTGDTTTRVTAVKLEVTWAMPSTTVNYQIADTANDATVNTVNGVFSSTGVHPYGPNGSSAGYRFPNVSIPAGKVITSATLTVKPSSGSGGTTNAGQFKAVALDNVGVWSSGNTPLSVPKVGGVTISNASGSSNAISTDVTSLIQTIVSRAGWSSGNALAIVYDSSGATGDGFGVLDYSTSNADAARLSITYEDAVPVTVTVNGASKQSLTITGYAAMVTDFIAVNVAVVGQTGMVSLFGKSGAANFNGVTAGASTEVLFTTPGAITWTSPITGAIKAEGWGGGGGNNEANSYPGGGGGYARKNALMVTAGQTYNGFVGDGGLSGTGANQGGSTWFGGTNSYDSPITAIGGGSSGWFGASAAGGGNYPSNVGDVTYLGGGVANFQINGGGAAGPTGPGGASTNSTGGNAASGALGGTGASPDGQSNVDGGGGAYGGYGFAGEAGVPGGGAAASGPGANTPKKGGRGQLRLTYAGVGGQSVTVTSIGSHDVRLTGQQGSSAITFEATANGQTGSLSITGRQGSTNANVTGTGSKGALAISGYPGNVTLSTAVTGVAGTISLAGLIGTVSAERNVIVTGQAGSIALNPFQGSANTNATIMGDVGSLTVAGYPATVSVNLSVQSAADASLTLSGASGAYRVDHSTTGNLGGLVIAGYAASVISTDNVSVAGSNAVLTVTGRQGTMVFTSNPTVSGGKGAISINGHQGSVGTNTQVQGSASALQINGLAGSVTSTVQIDGTAQSVALTGRFGAARIDHTVSGGRQSLTVLGRQATVGSTVSATGGTQALQIVGHAASVFESDNVSVVANGAALTVTGYAGSIVNNINLNAGFDTLSISEFEGRTDASVNLTAGARQSLQITGYSAEVDSRVVVPVFGFTGALTVIGRQGEVSTSVAVESVGQGLSITGRVGDTNAEVTVLGASKGTVSTTGRQGSTNSGAEIIAFPGSVSITGHNASIYEEDNFALTGGTGAMTVTGHAGRTDTDIILTGANDNVAITGFAGTAEATVSVTVDGQTGQIGLNGLVGSYGFGADVEGGAGSISITSYPASIIVSQNPVGESQDPLQIVGHVGRVEQAVYVFGQTGTVTLISLTGDTSIFDTISHVESAHRYTVRADKRKAEVNAQKRIATILAETRRVKAG